MSVPPKVKRFVELWISQVGREIDIASHMSALTLDIIGDVGFSHAFGGLAEVEKWAASQNNEPEIASGAVADPLIQSLTQVSSSMMLMEMILYDI